MILSKQEAQDVIYGDSEMFSDAVPNSKKITGNSRWYIYRSAVFQHIESGKFYKFDWQEGATEYQDTEPFYNDFEPVEVELKEVTKKGMGKRMKEVTITKKYLVFGKDDYEEARKYLNDVAYFDDTLAEMEIHLKSPNPEFSTTFNEIWITSDGIKYVDDDSEPYNFMAVEKPEVITPKPTSTKKIKK